MNPLFSTLPTTIFEEMSGLARQHKAINLGQGFPDSQGPLELRLAAGAALLSGTNQYPPMMGLPVLRQAVADHYNRLQGADFQAENVVITSGATEALAACFLTLLRQGDEVIVLDPAYDAYRPLIERAGGLARSIALKPPHWQLDCAAIEAAITPKTRAIVFNNPMNPVGRCFGRDELFGLAKLCIDHDLIAICDEVWEHVVFDEVAHHSMIQLPGMQERTIKIGSAGKIFSMTGWKVGFTCASVALSHAIAKAHQFLTFTTAPHLQEAVALGLSWDQAWFQESRIAFAASRDRLQAGLSQSGFSSLNSQGTYFLCLDLRASGIELDAPVFCRRAVTEFGVATIPLAPFYAQPSQSPPIIRLCFAKNNATLDQAVERLAQARAFFTR